MQTVEDLWVESVHRYREREREEHRWAWIRHFDQMARLHGDLSASYTARAEALMGRPMEPRNTPAHVRDEDGSGGYLISSAGGAE